MTSSEYIKQLLSVEEYSFSLEEIITATNKGEIAVRSELSRLVVKKEIVNLRKGFYLIIPPRYSLAGKLPVQLYSEKLFSYLNRRYYLGLYTAAKIHGASHQQTQRDYLLIEKPKLNDIKKKHFDIRFFTTSNWPEDCIQTKKLDAGNYKISSPSLTLADLVHHQTKLGGLNRMSATVEELAEELTEDDLARLLSWYPHKSTVQRMGFLLESLLRESQLTDTLMRYLELEKYFPVLLSPSSSQKPGKVYNKWKVDVNIKLDNDL
ncbi:MAG: type IV toxin-antitoxin system AbiEi family antitoxin [Imperialibacter sp.]|uniref:type IV toxin-antitoxin system AbiEi family antitoxin domain-containing protein n=1 Tax=Imperialibacter sp. TaxID=2038411 RepID=UPI0032EBACF6